MKHQDSDRLLKHGRTLDLTNDERHRLKKLSAVVEEIKENMKGMSNKNNPHGYRVIKVTKNGSFNRQTAVQGASDADIILLLYNKHMKTKPPKVSVVLRTLLQATPKMYNPIQKRKAITITEKVKTNGNRLQVDIVPMLTDREDGKTEWVYTIDPRGVHRKWVESSPKGQTEIVGRLKRRSGKKNEQKDDPTALVRVLKNWRATFEAQSPPCPLPSYVLEVLVWYDYKLHSEVENNICVRFNRVLNSLGKTATKGIDLSNLVNRLPPKRKKAQGLPLLHDPACLSTNLLQHMRQEDLLWWVKEARRDANPNRPFEKVFPKEA